VDVVNYSDPNTGNTWLLNKLTDLIWAEYFMIRKF
jgi:hypothetical protein